MQNLTFAKKKILFSLKKIFDSAFMYIHWKERLDFRDEEGLYFITENQIENF